MKASVQIRSTAAAKGSQSATEPIIVAAEVAAKIPPSRAIAEVLSRRVGFEKKTSRSFARSSRRYSIDAASWPLYSSRSVSGRGGGSSSGKACNRVSKSSSLFHCG